MVEVGAVAVVSKVTASGATPDTRLWLTATAIAVEGDEVDVEAAVVVVVVVRVGVGVGLVLLLVLVLVLVVVVVGVVVVEEVPVLFGFFVRLFPLDTEVESNECAP